MTSATPNRTLPNPVEVSPILPNPALLEANWADAFEVTIQSPFADMRSLAQASVGSMPTWARNLLMLRNSIVRPLGLKPDGVKDAKTTKGLVHIFPVHSEAENSIVLGLDDRHLDFRIVLERECRMVGDQVRLTTLVQHHNMFGYCYIMAITPFHRAIVRSVLKQVL